MPFLKVETSMALADEVREHLMKSLSTVVSETIGKPEKYVMIALDSTPLMMGGRSGEAAFAEVRSIGGLGGNVNTQLSRRVCEILGETLGIKGDRVYLNFREVEAGDWGWNGGTFG
jgi:phenylpyruvate tautomerase